MSFRRKLADLIVKNPKLRLFIRQAYWSILKFEETAEKLLVNESEKLELTVAKTSNLHFEAVKSIASELRVVDHENKLTRYGGDFDGGYVMAEPISRNLSILSLGVGSDISWDEEIGVNALAIHLYDHTVDRLPVEIDVATHFKTEVGSQSKPHSVTLQECISRLPISNDYILKIDIEGAEWAVLDEVDTDLLDRFSQIVIEFHGLHEHVLSLKILQVMEVLRKLSTNHDVINFHPNNYGNFEIIGNHPVPDVFEVTYLRRNLVMSKRKEPQTRVNSPNTSFHADIVLNFP
jgi:FkbM family methyltransferase